VNAFQELIIERGDDPEEKITTALKFIGVYILIIPFYLSVNSFLRDWFQASLEHKSKLAKFDGSVVGYVLGFALQILIGSVVYQMITKENWFKEYIFFMLELILVALSVFYLEKLRAHASAFSDQAAAVVTLAIEVAERAFSVALGFAWLHSYKWIYDGLVEESYGENFEGDDSTWLDVPTGEEGKGGGRQNTTSTLAVEIRVNNTSSGDTEDIDILSIQEQAWLGIVWLILIFVLVSLHHSFIETNARRRKLKESREDDHAEEVASNLTLAQTRMKERRHLRHYRYILKRIRIAYLSLAFGFALQKILGDLFMNGLGWNATGKLWASSFMATLVLYFLAIRKAVTHMKRIERRSLAGIHQRTTIGIPGGTKHATAFDSGSESSDDEIFERRPIDGDSSFVVANEMWLERTIEMAVIANPNIADSTVTSQPEESIIQLGPFADSGESNWHYDLCCSCSPALCVSCKCCSKTNCCTRGFPCVQAYCGYCGCCHIIPLGHLSTKLEASGVHLRIKFYGIIYGYYGLLILQGVILNNFGIHLLPINVFAFFAFSITFYLRGKMRKKLNLRGSAIDDFVCSICCNGCVIMQMVGQAWKSPPGCTLNDIDGCVE